MYAFLSFFIFRSLLRHWNITKKVENVALCVSRRGSAGVGCRPFVLVGHSFGGLVIKALINETKRRSDSAETNALDKKAIGKAKEFLQNLKGIVFYAVPHSGADAATLLSYFKFVGLSKIIGNLTPFSRRMAKMSVMMQDTVYNKGIIIYAFGEGKPTYSNKVCTISQL
jgi:triacylglycerol esterase/lipase EstA (alpha/beta hydrolase family)